MAEKKQEVNDACCSFTQEPDEVDVLCFSSSFKRGGIPIQHDWRMVSRGGEEDPRTRGKKHIMPLTEHECRVLAGPSRFLLVVVRPSIRSNTFRLRLYDRMAVVATYAIVLKQAKPKGVHFEEWSIRVARESGEGPNTGPWEICKAGWLDPASKTTQLLRDELTAAMAYRRSKDSYHCSECEATTPSSKSALISGHRHPGIDKNWVKI